MPVDAAVGAQGEEPGQDLRGEAPAPSGFNMETLGREFAERLLPPPGANDDAAQGAVGGGEKQAQPQRAGGVRHEVQDGRAGAAAGGVLDNFGRDVVGQFFTKGEELRRAISGAGKGAPLQDFAQRELDEGQRSVLLERLGRDLFQHTTVAVENTTKTVLRSRQSPRPEDGEPRSLEDGEEESPSKPSNPRMELEARCPWCAEVCAHSVLSARTDHDGPAVQMLLQRKQEYVCGRCGKQTCPCDKHAACQGLAKRMALWDDALCKPCDDAERAEAQAFLGMMSQIVDGVKDGSGTVIGGVVDGVVDHSKGLVEGSGNVIGGVVDGVVDGSRGLVDDVKEHSELMADKSHFKGMVQKLNSDFSKLGESGKDFVGNIASAAGGAVGGAVEGVVRVGGAGAAAGGEVEAGAVDDDGSGKYLQLMLGHIKGGYSGTAALSLRRV